jgi:hypothetical protein
MAVVVSALGRSAGANGFVLAQIKSRGCLYIADWMSGWLIRTQPGGLMLDLGQLGGCGA